MGGCIGDYIRSKVEVFGAGGILDLDGFEDVPASQDSMCSIGGDVESGDWNACLVLGISF